MRSLEHMTEWTCIRYRVAYPWLGTQRNRGSATTCIVIVQFGSCEWLCTRLQNINTHLLPHCRCAQRFVSTRLHSGSWNQKRWPRSLRGKLSYWLTHKKPLRNSETSFEIPQALCHSIILIKSLTTSLLLSNLTLLDFQLMACNFIIIFNKKHSLNL